MPPSGESPGARPGFGAGVRAVFEGFGTIARTPSLWPMALVPLVVLLALEAVFVTLAVTLGAPFVRSLFSAESELGRVGVSLLSYGAIALLAVIGWLVAVPLASPLSAPALEHVVRRVESDLGVPPRTPLGFFRELACGFRALAGGLAVCVPLLALLWLVELVLPPVVVVTTPLKIMVSSLLVAWGLFDYPLTLRGIGFRARFALVRENFTAVLGFGLAFLLVFWVPCCGVALLPVGAAAATRLVVEIERGKSARIA
ncbi:MAG TPA: EI24 domain-containing protein [Polyangiaceae bacterium]|nr:EI24 domain-containing protein [Polyangiaceae bacterium]